MKVYLSTAEAVQRLMADEYAAWSYRGATALVEYLEELEHEIKHFVFNVIDIRCEFHEWSDAVTCAVEHGWEPGDSVCDGDEVIAKAVDWLQNRATVIRIAGARSIIVSNF
jgi:hypothetical protein